MSSEGSIGGHKAAVGWADMEIDGGRVVIFLAAMITTSERLVGTFRTSRGQTVARFSANV